jgi:hypothetical protein
MMSWGSSLVQITKSMAEAVSNSSNKSLLARDANFAGRLVVDVWEF